MLKFFREKKAVVGWGIVIFFAGTMFTGSLFFGGASSQQAQTLDQMQSRDQAVALLGDVIVSPQVFYKNVNRLLADPRSVGNGSPEALEDVLFRGLSLSIEEVVFLTLADQAMIDVHKAEIREEEEKMIINLGLKNKKELKSALKENNRSYESFTNELERSIRIQKYLGLIEQQIEITDQDVDNKYSQVYAKHILFQPNGETSEELLKMANDVYLQIEQGLSFDEAARLYSSDDATKENGGTLGWLTYSDKLPDFEDQVFSLNVGQVSTPFKTPLGVHIATVTDKKLLPRPQDFNLEEEKRYLAALRYNYEKNLIVQRFLSQNPLLVQDPQLVPLDAKRRNDIQGAINGYQVLSGENPRSPIPNYHLAKLYFRSNDLSEGARQLEIAATKVDLEPSFDFPELHLLFALFHREGDDLERAFAAYDRAIELSKDNFSNLEMLKAEMVRINNDERVQYIDTLIEDLKRRVEEYQQSLDEASSEDTDVEAQDV